MSNLYTGACAAGNAASKH